MHWPSQNKNARCDIILYSKPVITDSNRRLESELDIGAIRDSKFSVEN